MSPRRARAVARARPMALALLLLVAACNGGPPATGVDDPLPSAVERTREPVGSSTVPTATPRTSIGATTQADTDWGRIWNTVPSGFPVHPGAVASTGAGSEGPVSARWTVPGAAAAEVAEWLQARLELATYSTEALSGPFEDGSYVVDSVGDADCRIETSVVPDGDMTIVAVRYGADCPSE